MANTSITNTVLSIKRLDGGGMEVIGTIAVGASALTYFTGGIPIAWPATVKTETGLPVFMDIQGMQGTFSYRYDIANGKLRIFIVSTQAEIANGVAIDALISGDIITYLAKFGSRSLL